MHLTTLLSVIPQRGETRTLFEIWWASDENHGLRPVDTRQESWSELRRYRIVATGGTFDHLHRGHEALLKKSFEMGDEVVIGVTSDGFVAKEGKKPDSDYAARVRGLKRYLSRQFPGRKYIIAKLHDTFGPGIASEDVQAIVVSPETAGKVPIANGLRAEKGFKPLDVIVVDWVLAEDGRSIASNRIRKGEIDRDGKLLSGGARHP